MSESKIVSISDGVFRLKKQYDEYGWRTGAMFTASEQNARVRVQHSFDTEEVVEVILERRINGVWREVYHIAPEAGG